MKFIKILESLDIDVRMLLGNSMARSNLPTHYTLFDFVPNLAERLATVGLMTDDLDEMCEDAGITQQDIVQLFVYLQSADDTASTPVTMLEERLEASLFLLRYYEQKLASWFLLGGYDVNYSLWGM